MPQYNNIIRPGVRSSTSINPRALVEDISERIRKLRPEATPIITLGQYLKRGPKPVNHKIQTIQYDIFDHYDYVNRVVLGKDFQTQIGQGAARFAKLFLTQPSRPSTRDTMPYFPQDKFFIAATGQTVEVVMTPTSSMTRSVNNESRYELPTEFTGATPSTSEPGSIIVRTVDQVPFAAFTTSDVIYMGRTIYESQRIEAESLQRDYYYDCNYVEHKEAVLHMTEDQRYWVKTKGTAPDWTFQQEQMIDEFKMSVEHTLLWGERAFDGTIPGRPKRHMNGLYHAVHTNVAVYNPDSVDDFESLINNFCYDMAFRYNPNGKKKIALCGGRVLMRFNEAFKHYRRLDGAAPSDKKVGLDMDTFVMPGGFELKLIRSELLRQGTALENWMFVVDPAEMEQRIVKDFTTRMYQGNDERDVKLVVEWQGSIAWHLEQTHAILRT